jgi:hypothetical protein
MTSWKDLRWQKVSAGWALMRGGRAVVHVVPDTDTGLWRVRLPGGGFTDSANLTRAMDAAPALALRQERGAP